MTAHALTAERVFPGAGFVSHMPFFDGKTLLFCRAEGAMEHTFLSEGQIWERMTARAELQARFASRARERKTSFRRWKIHAASWEKRPRAQEDRRRERSFASLMDAGLRHHDLHRQGVFGKRVHTGLPETAVECSPTFYVDNGTYHVSFIGGIAGPRWLEYRLYSMSGPALDQLTPAVDAGVASVGFIGPRYECRGVGPLLHLLDRRTGEEFSLACPHDHVYLATYVAGRDQQLLVTGRKSGGPFITLLYDLEDDETLEVLGAGEEVYKSSIYQDRIVFARRCGQDPEDRELWHAPCQKRRAREQVRKIKKAARKRSGR